MVAKKNARQRRAMPQSVILILQTGRDFFGDLTGGVQSNFDLLRDAWADEEIKQGVFARHKERHPEGGRPWAARVFDV